MPQTKKTTNLQIQSKGACIAFLMLLMSFQVSAQWDLISRGIGSLTSGQLSDAAGGMGTQVVYDPANKVQLATVITETKKTAEALNEQLDHLERIRTTMEKVNDFVRQVNYVEDIIEIEQRIFELSQQSINDAKSMSILYDSKVISVLQSFNANLQGLASSLELARKVLEDDFFSMESADRIQLLIELRREARNHYTTARQLHRIIRDIGSLHMLERLYGNNRR